MAFCSHCGSPTTGGRFCPACGSPIARDAVASLTAGLLRRPTIRLIVAGLALFFLVGAGLVASRVMHREPRAGALRAAESVAPAAQPVPPAQSPTGQAIAAETSPSQPPPTPAAVPSANNAAVHPSTSSIDPQEVQRALNTLAQRADRGEAQPAASAGVSGSDRYPGSQPVEVKDVSVPDIGVPVASEVYTTTDSVAAVVDYYRQRYPEAELTEVNGQKIVAVNQPGAIKVIAVGTTGSETRIAIVQPEQ